MIEISLFDRGADLWQEARAHVHADGAGLVVAGRMAVAEQARARGSTIFGDSSLLSMNELFAATEAAMLAAERPPSASDRLVRLAVLDRLLGDPEMDVCDELRRCRPLADREVLLSWIDQVSSRADREHTAAATTPVELGIERLRVALNDRGVVSEPMRRAQIARRSAGVRLGHPLIVGPLPLSDPFATGLLKGLARHQEIGVLGLTTAPVVEAWLVQARLGPGWETPPPRTELGRADVAGHLYSDRSGTGAVGLIEAGDEFLEALAQVRRLTGDGVDADQITLVLARPERDLARLEQLAARAEVPLLARVTAGPTDTPLGRLALAAARPGLGADELASAGRPLGLGRAEADAIAALTGLARARILHRELSPLAERAGIPAEVRARELNWIEALAVEVQVAEAIEPPPACSEIVAGARTRSLLVGEPEGVAVVGYSEAQGLERSHLIATGLSDGDWPPRERPSPFVSALTVAACPGLAPPDRRVDFTAALAAAEETLLVRQARDGAGRARPASILYAAAERAGAALVPAIARHAMSGGAPRLGRSRRRTQREANRDRDRDRFSISELTQYLACPRGWEVAYGLGLEARETQAQRRGQIAHRMLEAAFSQPEAELEERLELAEAALRADPAARGLDAAARQITSALVTRTIRTLAPPAWPFQPILVEDEPPAMRYERLDALVVGRVDRIDEMPGGDLLLIDYKSGRRPMWRGADWLARDMQACIYPQMVAKHLERRVHGAIFVSVRQEGFDGLVRRLVPGLDGPTLHANPDLLVRDATRNLEDAIDGIRAGRVDEAGPGCWSGCPCQVLRSGS